ncbi:MAG TPA: hypothetical protein VE465_18170 [Streptosporangiaceae bacterium]|nr:hypothetical protein [Streptosporangiaceae bacterium]
MASLIRRVERYLRSPQGRQARARVERAARDPRTRAKVRRLIRRLASRNRRY